MEDRTATCTDCGATFTHKPLGAVPRRCVECLTPKLRAQRLRRARGDEPARCAGPCDRPLAGYRPLPGADVFCSRCGPGPGITRRTNCRHCGKEFYRRQRGGGTEQRRVHLCNECETTHKWCAGCETVKPRDAFSMARDKTTQLVSRCKPCHAEAWHRGDKLERVAKKFGMTKARWLELFAAQGGRCAICRAEPKDRPRGYLMVDHDHDCCPGQTSCGACVRGLLCLTCNTSLGGFHDSRDNLLAALAYLDTFKPG